MAAAAPFAYHAQKNTTHAAEQERPDVHAARETWFAAQPEFDPAKLVFSDETGADTKMVRRYGWAPRGQRCRAAVPYGHWTTTTVTLGLRCDGLTAPLVLDGAMDGECFLACIKQILVPALAPGDTVVMDNLPAHHVRGVPELIERLERGCSICRPILPISIRSNSPLPS